MRALARWWDALCSALSRRLGRRRVALPPPTRRRERDQTPEEPAATLVRAVVHPLGVDWYHVDGRTACSAWNPQMLSLEPVPDWVDDEVCTELERTLAQKTGGRPDA